MFLTSAIKVPTCPWNSSIKSLTDLQSALRHSQPDLKLPQHQRCVSSSMSLKGNSAPSLAAAPYRSSKIDAFFFFFLFNVKMHIFLIRVLIKVHQPALRSDHSNIERERERGNIKSSTSQIENDTGSHFQE